MKNVKSSSDQSSRKTYVFYNQLSFLGSSATNRPTTSNVSPAYDDNELGAEPSYTQDNHNENLFESTEGISKSNFNELEENSFGTIARTLEFRNQMENEAMEDLNYFCYL